MVTRAIENGIVDGRMAATWKAEWSREGVVSEGCRVDGSRGRTGMFGRLLPKGDASCGEAGQNKCRASAKTCCSQGRQVQLGEAAGEVFERNSPMTMPSRPLLVCGSNTRPEKRGLHNQLHVYHGATRKEAAERDVAAVRCSAVVRCGEDTGRRGLCLVLEGAQRSDGGICELTRWRAPWQPDATRRRRARRGTCWWRELGWLEHDEAAGDWRREVVHSGRNAQWRWEKEKRSTAGLEGRCAW
jgi:hypothetical protein